MDDDGNDDITRARMAQERRDKWLAAFVVAVTLLAVAATAVIMRIGCH